MSGWTSPLELRKFPEPSGPTEISSCLKTVTRASWELSEAGFWDFHCLVGSGWSRKHLPSSHYSKKMAACLLKAPIRIPKASAGLQLPWSSDPWRTLCVLHGGTEQAGPCVWSAALSPGCFRVTSSRVCCTGFEAYWQPRVEAVLQEIHIPGFWNFVHSTLKPLCSNSPKDKELQCELTLNWKILLGGFIFSLKKK